MGKYLFESDRVHYWDARGQGVMAADEFRASGMPLDRQAHILLAAEEGEELFVRLREARSIFARGRIRTLVPYAQALGAFLVERGLMDDSRMCLVLDDVGGRFILTAMLASKVLATRMVPAGDIDRVVDEMHRTQKSVGGHKAPGPWRVLSNHEGIVAAVREDEDVDVEFFETFLPAMQVLGRVKFARALMTPQEVAANRRRECLLAWAISVAAGMALAAAGVGYYVDARLRMDRAQKSLAAWQARQQQVRRYLEKVSIDSYQDRLRHLPSISVAGSMQDLFGSVVAGMRVASVTLERCPDMRWYWSADIEFPDGRHLPWQGRGIWSSADVSALLTQGRSGLRIGKRRDACAGGVL